jgi:hypothetical protein
MILKGDSMTIVFKVAGVGGNEFGIISFLDLLPEYEEIGI